MVILVRSTLSHNHTTYLLIYGVDVRPTANSSKIRAGIRTGVACEINSICLCKVEDIQSGCCDQGSKIANQLHSKENSGEYTQLSTGNGSLLCGIPNAEGGGGSVRN